MVKSTPRSIKFPLRSRSLNVGIELWGWGAPEWCLHRWENCPRLAGTVFACLWREVYVVACLRQLGSSVNAHRTCVSVWCEDLRTPLEGLPYWHCNLSSEFHVSCHRPTCAADEFSAAIYLRITTLQRILFFHTLSKCVFLYDNTTE